MHNIMQVVVSCSQSEHSINIQISKLVNKEHDGDEKVTRLRNWMFNWAILWHVEDCLWKVTDSRYSDPNCRKAALERISKDMDGIDVSEWQYDVPLSVELRGHENVTPLDWGDVISHGHIGIHVGTCTARRYVVNSDTIEADVLLISFYRATLC